MANIFSQLLGGGGQQQLGGFGGLQNLGALGFLSGQLKKQGGEEEGEDSGLTPGIMQLFSALQSGGLSGALGAGVPGLAGTATSALEGKDPTQSFGILGILAALGR